VVAGVTPPTGGVETPVEESAVAVEETAEEAAESP